jgi:hypothetical protein
MWNVSFGSSFSATSINWSTSLVNTNILADGDF